MKQTILLGQGNQIKEIPRTVWEGHLAQVPEHGPSRLSFMSEDHHRVRYFVVSQLPRLGRAIEPAYIAEKLKLQLDQVKGILAELEENLFFLVRNEQGAVSWAFPITVEPTPHRLTFDSGEQIYAA